SPDRRPPGPPSGTPDYAAWRSVRSPARCQCPGCSPEVADLTSGPDGHQSDRRFAGADAHALLAAPGASCESTLPRRRPLALSLSPAGSVRAEGPFPGHASDPARPSAPVLLPAQAA